MGRKSKIVRNDAYYSDEDYNYDVEIGMEYVAHDIGQTILLFQIDRIKNNDTNFYGETIGKDSVSYKDPVELSVVLTLGEAENKAYDKSQNVGRYLQAGKLTFGIYEKTLDDANVDISYGDYVGYQVKPDQMEYFVVTNDGKVNFDNRHTMFGRRSFFRSIEASISDKNEFNGI